MYKMYNDIKEEKADEEKMIEFFSLPTNFSGVRTIEGTDYKTSGFFTNGKPHGLVIVHNKADDSKLYARFEDGKPHGVWIKYDKYGRKIESREYKY